MKTRILDQFYCLLFDIDEHTRKSGILVDVKIYHLVEKKENPITLQIPTSSEEVLEDLLPEITSRTGLKAPQIRLIEIFGCEEKPTSKENKRIAKDLLKNT